MSVLRCTLRHGAAASASAVVWLYRELLVHTFEKMRTLHSQKVADMGELLSIIDRAGAKCTPDEIRRHVKHGKFSPTYKKKDAVQRMKLVLSVDDTLVPCSRTMIVRNHDDDVRKLSNQLGYWCQRSEKGEK